ncbi:response regulator [Myxococcota bacterium]|nr:response regulator [Myxococcota bacterium]MBU1431267.1 response regulator [Myxococcota bacterium]
MLSTDSKILVVDDFSTMRRIVKATLKQLGYERIVEAEGGEEAQKIIKDDQIDLIICDWNMPGMSGLDLLKWVRATDSFKDVPFLMVTAEAKRQNILSAIQAGVTNYVVKPFSKQVLAEKIQAIAEKA